MEGATQLRFHLTMEEHETRLQQIDELLRQLTPSQSTKKIA